MDNREENDLSSNEVAVFHPFLKKDNSIGTVRLKLKSSENPPVKLETTGEEIILRKQFLDSKP